MRYEEKYLILNSDCVIVKGYRRSTICDLTRKNYKLIPNILYDILKEYDKKKIVDIYENYGKENSDFIDEYIKFLVENEFILVGDEDEIDTFPKLDFEFKEPNYISNAIIDVDYFSEHDYQKIFSELQILACRNLQIRMYSIFKKEKIEEVLSLLKDKDFQYINLMIQYSEDLSHLNLNSILETYKVYNIDIFNTPKTVKESHKEFNSYISYYVQPLKDETYCGVIHKAYFNTNIKLFSESQKYNNCLNKKISIDKYGYIKNCPSISKNFGHHKNTTFLEVIENKVFTDKWSISKDQIEICKDCEFRYVCTDCRGYTVSENPYSKPLKCKYDPYEAIWRK